MLKIILIFALLFFVKSDDVTVTPGTVDSNGAVDVTFGCASGGESPTINNANSCTAKFSGTTTIVATFNAEDFHTGGACYNQFFEESVSSNVHHLKQLLSAMFEVTCNGDMERFRFELDIDQAADGETTITGIYTESDIGDLHDTLDVSLYTGTDAGTDCSDPVDLNNCFNFIPDDVSSNANPHLYLLAGSYRILTIDAALPLPATSGSVSVIYKDDTTTVHTQTSDIAWMTNAIDTDFTGPDGSSLAAAHLRVKIPSFVNYGNVDKIEVQLTLSGSFQPQTRRGIEEEVVAKGSVKGISIIGGVEEPVDPTLAILISFFSSVIGVLTILLVCSISAFVVLFTCVFCKKEKKTENETEMKEEITTEV